MSTVYRELNYPWSSIKVKENPTHTRIALWEKGAYVGELTVSSDNLSDILPQFFGEEVMQHYAGPDNSVKLIRLEGRPPRTDQMLSEYSDLVSLRDLEKRFDPQYYTKEDAENVI